jgi:hypothetical protein
MEWLIQRHEFDAPRAEKASPTMITTNAELKSLRDDDLSVAQRSGAD